MISGKGPGELCPSGSISVNTKFMQTQLPPELTYFLIAVIAVEYQDAQDANFSKAVQQLCQAACK